MNKYVTKQFACASCTENVYSYKLRKSTRRETLESTIIVLSYENVTKFN